jgi:hypothetical protein
MLGNSQYWINIELLQNMIEVAYQYKEQQISIVFLEYNTLSFLWYPPGFATTLSKNVTIVWWKIRHAKKESLLLFWKFYEKS